MNLLTQIKHKTQKGEEVIMDIGAKASNVLPENFVEQKERSNLTAKDKLPVIFGKLSKWYTDLKAVAWSGSYSDLTNKPTIPEGSAANYQVANNDTTEAEGFVADARIVRTHGLEIDGLSRDFAGGQMEIRLTAAGKGEYRKKGADTWIPFKADPLNVVLKFAVDCTWDGAGHSYLTCSIDGQTFINHYLLPKSVYDQTFDLAVKGVPASIRIYVKYSWLDTGDHYDATITVNEFNFLNGTYGWNNTDNEKNIRVLLF